MAMSDDRKQTVNLQLAVAVYTFTTGLMLLGGPTMDQCAQMLTDGLNEINNDSTDVPKGLDMRATLLSVEGLANLNPNMFAGHAGEAAAWAVSAAALL